MNLPDHGTGNASHNGAEHNASPFTNLFLNVVLLVLLLAVSGLSACSADPDDGADGGGDAGLDATPADEDVEPDRGPETIFCEATLQCPADQACLFGHCQSSAHCAGEVACSGFRAVLDPRSCACVMCTSDGDCPESEGPRSCRRGQCRYCPHQTTDPAECAARGLHLDDGCCVECVDDTGCTGIGRACRLGRCVDASSPECISASDCDGDRRCDTGRCVEPSSGQTCTRQLDCPTGEACYAEGRCRREGDRQGGQVCAGCPEPSRCVAEPGDTAGTCAGCTAACQPDGCPDGALCHVPDGAPDGYCVPRAQLPTCS